MLKNVEIIFESSNEDIKNKEFLILLIFYTVIGFSFHLFSKIKTLVFWEQAIFYLWIIFIVVFGIWFYKNLRVKRQFIKELGLEWNVRVLLLTATGLVLIIILPKGNIQPLSVFNLTMLALGAIIEEIIFRSMFLRWLIYKFRNIKSRDYMAVILSAILFSIIHMPDKPIHLVFGLFLSAIILGWLYLWSGSIIFGLILHSYANAGQITSLIIICVYLLITRFSFIKTEIGLQNNDKDFFTFI